MDDPRDGCLVLVVGPSGAGKDTLIRKAAEALGGDARFIFPRRRVTRVPDAALEDHDTIGRADFEELRASGDHTLCWEAHGLGYVIPAAVAGAVAAGRIAVCNVSRRVLAEALVHYPASQVVVVTADREERKARLVRRGRETATEIDARLAREGAVLPSGIKAVAIDNSGALDEAVTVFVDALKAIAGR